jgi:acyl-coenzyme A thioesterase PaaI-like protein
MRNEFEQISLKPGFMKHNGGILFKTISENEYQFKTSIKENHLNTAGIVHGGFIATFVDAGAGTAAHRVAIKPPWTIPAVLR